MAHYESLQPSPQLRSMVESYWIALDDHREVFTQKILPDGFPEIIFHFGDSYRININGVWATQSRSLMAGQLKKHFFLENTGRSEILGIKVRPTMLSRYFGLRMDAYTDCVVDLTETGAHWKSVEHEIRSASSMTKRIEVVEEFLKTKVTTSVIPSLAEQALRLIFESKGLVTIKDIAQQLGVTDRHLENQFKKQVGLLPKLYARIIRFNHVFQLLKNQQPDWMNLVAQAGYYDQSHFIRNFKAFAGEDPSRYGFTEKNLANFFLQKD